LPFLLVLPLATADSTLLPLVLFFLGALVVVFVLLDDAAELTLTAVRFGSAEGPRLISYSHPRIGMMVLTFWLLD
jgi:hypothetical protein